MKPNRYIKAMEIGLANEDIGITYNDLIDKLQEETGKMTLYAESTFYYWFIDNFSATNIETKLASDWKRQFEFYYYFKNKIDIRKQQWTETGENVFIRLDSAKWFLNGEAAKQYLDYQELVESRKAATQAKTQSNISIGIAIFALIASSVLGLASLYSTQDVNVIEDKTKAERLEKENQRLNQELYKAEIMLEAYESDSI